MKRKYNQIRTALAVSIALCSVGAVSAEESHGGSHSADASGHGSSHSSFSYNFTELRYINVTVDEPGGDLDGDGFEFMGSVGLGDKFQAYFLYEDIGFDHDIDLAEWAIGFGTHMPIVDGTDFVAELGYISEDIKEPGHATHSDDGYQLGIGVRHKVGEKGEVQFGIDFVDFSGAGSITSFELAGEMHVSSNVALGLGVDLSDEATAYFAEARIYFGGH